MDGLTVIYRDETKERFEYSRDVPRVEYPSAHVVVIVDTWGARHTIPLDLVKRVSTDTPPGRW